MSGSNIASNTVFSNEYYEILSIKPASGVEMLDRCSFV